MHRIGVQENSVRINKQAPTRVTWNKQRTMVAMCRSSTFMNNQMNSRAVPVGVSFHEGPLKPDRRAQADDIILLSHFYFFHIIFNICAQGGLCLTRSCLSADVGLHETKVLVSLFVRAKARRQACRWVHGSLAKYVVGLARTGSV